MGAEGPLLFESNRVWRCYTGGTLLDRFVGRPVQEDAHEPEEWLASTVRALNGEHSKGPDEGISRVRAPGGRGPLLTELLASSAASILGPRHAARYGAGTAVLCKYLDSAVRLPIQCHPDVPLARTLYHSEFGKTESWYILDTRRIDGGEPYVLMGFKHGVTRAEFARTVEEQDIPAMEAMLHRIPVSPGQMLLVPARLPHAIGPGVFMLETQEPSDWVVQPERFCADTELSASDMWGPLSPEQGLDVFDYTGLERDALLERVRGVERMLHKEPGGEVVEMIGPSQTRAFAVRRVEVVSRMRVKPGREFAIVVVAGGEGRMRWPGGARPIRRGDYFLQPFGVSEIEVEAADPLTLVLCLPPQP